jgi:predicted nucleic acid-binding Zn ribbon protein
MSQRAPRTLDQLLPRVLARLAEQSGRGHALVPIWNATVGPHISKHTSPQHLERGVLVVTVTSAEWVDTLSRQEASLREQLNERLGEAAITSLVFQLK